MNPSDFAREWVNSQDHVLAYISSLVFHLGEAEDLLQETAAQAFAQSGRYDPDRPFLPWAIGIARLVVLEHRRKMARDRHFFDDEVITGLAEVFERGAEQNDSAGQALSKCRERLSSRSREVLRLRYEEGLTAAEIATRSGETPGLVRALLHRIRQQLKNCVEQRLRDEGLSS